MFLPLLMLFASFVMTTVTSLVGAHLVGFPGAVLGMVAGLVLSFSLMARRVGR